MKMFAAVIAALVLSACMSTQGYDPGSYGQRIWRASGYSPDGCRKNLEAEAGGPVTVIETTGGVSTYAAEALYLGSQPLFHCRGVVTNVAGRCAPTGVLTAAGRVYQKCR